MKNLKMFGFNKFQFKWPFGFFILASAVQYREILFSGKKVGWDTLDAIFPHFLFMVDAFKNLKLPYYNPLIQGGFSFGENFFTAFLLNPIDIFLALLSTFLPPLFIFQMQFPIMAAMSGYWIYRFFYKVNNDQFFSLLGGLCYFSAMLFPVAGQMPFFYAFVLLAFLLHPFVSLIESKNILVKMFAILLLTSLLIKTYYFFIPFLLIISFFTLKKYRNVPYFDLIIMIGAASLFYALVTFPIMFNLKSSLSDLAGNFLSPEPRLRSLVPEQIFYNSSFISVLGDIIDSRLLPGKAWTKGFNLGILFLFVLQLILLFTKKEKVKEKSIILFAILFTMFIARGSLNSIHKNLPLIKSFRWAFSYIYFSQIFFLFFIFLFPINWNQKIKKGNLVVVFVFIVTFGYLFYPIESNQVSDNGERQSIENRKTEVHLIDNQREVGKPGDYEWENRKWLYTKTPTMNGYNNSIHPIFWYLKGSPESNQFIVSLCTNEDVKLKDRKDYPENDNQYLEEYRNDLLNLIQKYRCPNNVKMIDFTMEDLRFRTLSQKTLLLQNMNAFTLKSTSDVNEVKLPGGMRLLNSAADSLIDYSFNKSTWLKNIFFNLLFVGVLLLSGLQIFFKRLNK